MDEERELEDGEAPVLGHIVPDADSDLTVTLQE